MFPKRLLLLSFFFVLAFGPPGVLYGQWVQVNGPLQASPDFGAFGGAISCMAAGGNNLVIGTTGGGAFWTSNDGNTWSANMNNGIFNNDHVHTLASLNGYLFAGTTSAMYRSTDDGFSWRRIDGFLAETFAFGQFHNDLFAVIAGGVARSSDSGNTWKLIDSLSGKYITSIVSKGSLLFAGSSNYGMYRSSDNGVNWNILPGILYTDVEQILVNGENIYAATGKGTGILRSTDDGISWTHADSAISLAGFYYGITSIGQTGGNLIAAVASGVYYSTNNGSSWNSTWLSAHNANTLESGLGVYSPLLATKGKVYIATNRGLFVSTDNGVNWQPMNTGLRSLVIHFLATNAGVLFASTPILMRSTDDGSSWVAADVGLNDEIQAMIIDQGNIFIGNREGIFLSSDNGTHWQARNNGLSSRGEVRSFTTLNGSILAGSTDSGLFRSTDRGDSWMPFNANLPSLSVVAVMNENGKLFASLGRGIFRSVDAGASWAPLSFRDTETVIQLCGLGKIVFAVTLYGKLYRSTNDGDTWKKVDTGFTYDLTGIFSQIHTITQLRGALFVGADRGNMFVSTDSGSHWLRIDPNSDSWDWQSWCLAFAANDKYVFAGNSSRGVWRRKLSDFGITANVSAAKKEEDALSCYPNPFTSATTISLFSSVPAIAEVTVVNLLGVEVARIFSGELESGEHTFSWNAKPNLPDGMYECLVRMNGRVEKLQMFLLR